MAMTTRWHWLRYLQQLTGALLTLPLDVVRSLGLCLRSPAALVAENLLLRKQLALYREPGVRPRRATQATRIAYAPVSTATQENESFRHPKLDFMLRIPRSGR